MLKLFIITLPVNVCTLLYTQAVISNTFCAVYCFYSSQHSPLLLSLTFLFSVRTVHTRLHISAFFISKPFSQAPRLHLPCLYFFFILLSSSFFFFFATTCIMSFCRSSSFSLYLPIPLHLTMFTIISHSLNPLCQPCFSFSTRCLCPDGEALGQAERQTWLGYES